MADNRITFLESVGNLRPLIKARTGKVPSVGLTREITVCLQQGRLFYEAAADSPLEIRPLLLFYGLVGFAKSLQLATNLRPMATLDRAHGLRDTSSAGCTLRELRVRVGNRGAFQDFNDTMAPLSSIRYFGDQGRPVIVHRPSTESTLLDGLELTLQDILSRIPGLEDLYSSTFREEANTMSFTLYCPDEEDNPGYLDMTLWSRGVFPDRAGLRQVVTNWRDKFPCLKQWRLAQAQPAWGKSTFKLDTAESAGIDEFADEHLEESNGRFVAVADGQTDKEMQRQPLASILEGVGMDRGHGPTLIAPFQGRHLSEFSLHYLALYLLSCLVRYRPDVWGHSLSRMSTSSRPADDEVLALLDAFLATNQGTVPTMVTSVLDPHAD